MTGSALLTATAIGTVVQLAMVIAGHFVPLIKNNVFAVGGMAISLVAGLIYAMMAGASWGDSLLGGLVAGGVCALVGIVVSFILRDVPAPVIAFGTAGSAVTGLIGGAIGQLLG